jgi:hypothetical protein
MNNQKRVNLTHGSARVDKDCSKETIIALNKISELAYEMDPNETSGTDFKSSHNLDFEVAPLGYRIDGDEWQRFRIGTCSGLWRAFQDNYEILSISNSEKGNGHLIDVFEWFENSCKRDGYCLRVLEFFSPRFKTHLLEKRGFENCLGNNVIKKFK